MPQSLENSGKEKTQDGLNTSMSSTSGAEKNSSGMTASTPSSKLTSKLKTLPEILKTVLQNISERGTTPKYPTGLAEMDRLLWGLHKQQMIVLAARTSHGKSSLAMQMAIKMAKNGCKVGYFSLEMSKEQLVERMICNLLMLNSRLLRAGIMGSLKSQEQYLVQTLPSLKMLFDDEHGFEFDNIVELVKALKFDFVFIDYIQMVSTRGYRSKLDAIDEYVRKFKELCNTQNVGGIILSQVNRDGVENMGLHNLKSSGTLEEHPDTVLLLEWDWEADEYWVNVAKQRHGERGKFRVSFNPESFKFTDYIEKAPQRSKFGIQDV